MTLAGVWICAAVLVATRREPAASPAPRPLLPGDTLGVQLVDGSGKTWSERGETCAVTMILDPDCRVCQQLATLERDRNAILDRVPVTWIILGPQAAVDSFYQAYSFRPDRTLRPAYGSGEIGSLAQAGVYTTPLRVVLDEDLVAQDVVVTPDVPTPELLTACDAATGVALR